MERSAWRLPAHRRYTPGAAGLRIDRSNGGLLKNRLTNGDKGCRAVRRTFSHSKPWTALRPFY